MFPPPARVLVVDVNCIKEVPALKVKFVDVAKASTVPLDVKFIVLAPRLIVLTLLLLDDKTPAVTLYPAVVNVPFVTVSVLAPMSNASASCTVPPNVLIVMALGNVLPALVMVWVLPPEKVNVPDPLKETPEPFFQSPYTVYVDKTKFQKVVLADKSILPTYVMAVSSVIIPVTEPALVNVAVSCGNGKLSVDGVPVDVVAQAFADQFCAPAKFQYTVLGASNVMPLHSPRLPMRVPLIGADVPRAYKPRKSASVRLGAELTTKSTEMP